jgi:hypothetical protein
MQAPKNGFFYILDRKTGEILLCTAALDGPDVDDSHYNRRVDVTLRSRTLINPATSRTEPPFLPTSVWTVLALFDAWMGKSPQSNSRGRPLDLPETTRRSEALGSWQRVCGAQPGSRESRSRRGGRRTPGASLRGTRRRLPGGTAPKTDQKLGLDGGFGRSSTVTLPLSTKRTAFIRRFFRATSGTGASPRRRTVGCNRGRAPALAPSADGSA